MTPSEMRDELIERLVVAKSELFVTNPSNEPIDTLYLRDIAHHLRMIEILVTRLHGKSAALPKSPF